MIAIASVSGERSATATMNVLTPLGIFDPHSEWHHFYVSLVGGIALQTALIATILAAISNRLGRPAFLPAASET
jgi:hypothetical protein